MTMTTLMGDPAAMAAIEAIAATKSGSWHVHEVEGGPLYILGGVWGMRETSTDWGVKRFAHIEVAGESVPGSALAEKVAEWSGTDAAEAFPWTESHYQSRHDALHRTFLVLYRVPAEVPVRLKQGYRSGSNGWGKDETRYFRCDPATYHGYVRAAAAYAAAHPKPTNEPAEPVEPAPTKPRRPVGVIGTSKGTGTLL